MKTTSISMTTPDPAVIVDFLRAYAWECAAAGVAVVVIGLVMLAAVVMRRRQLKRAAASVAELQSLRADLGAMCASIAGFGERLVRIEQQLRSVGDRQDQLELRPGGERSYAHAIRMVQKGAGVEELVASCGINRGEAELLLRVHGIAQAS
jgi:hypothetical protein